MTLIKINKESVLDMCKEHQENVSKETKELGYETLIPKEELEAIKEVKKVVDKYIKVHNDCVKHDENVRNGGDSPYARIQYCKYSEIMDDFIKYFSLLLNVDQMDKEFIDRMAEKMDTNVKGLENKVMLDALLNKLTD